MGQNSNYFNDLFLNELKNNENGVWTSHVSLPYVFKKTNSAYEVSLW